MEYVLHLLILIAIYTLLAQSLTLPAGNAGLVSLAHAGFYGIGAYTAAILSTQFGCSFWTSLSIAMCLSGLAAWLIAIVAVRTIDDYFVICTLGAQVIIFSMLNNLSVTRGPLGIPGIPPVMLFGFSFYHKIPFLLLSLVFVAFSWAILRNIGLSGFGKVLIAVSEDEIYAKSIGKNIRRAKTVSFTISAVLAAIPGVLYAHYIAYIDPSSFSVNESIFILSICIIGGLGNLTGSFLASIFLILLPEALRLIGMPENMAANMRQIVYGFCLIGIVLGGRVKLLRLPGRIAKD